MAKHLFCQVAAGSPWKDYGPDFLATCNADPKTVCTALNKTFKEHGWLFEVREVSDDPHPTSESMKEP